MKKKGALFFTGALFSVILCFFPIFFLILTSCLFNQGNRRDNSELSAAFWNQKEYDRAMHKLHKKRFLFLSVSIRNGFTQNSDGIFSEKPFRLYTGKQKYGSEEEFSDIILDKNGTAKQKIDYNHSFIGIELTSSSINMGNGIDTAFFTWHRPGIWVKELLVDIDVSHFSSTMYPSSDEGLVRCDLFFNPGWREKKIWIRFEQLFALTSTPEEHPDGLSAKEAEIIRKGQGSISIILNMPGFFKRWNKNYVRPWQEGDVYPVSISLNLNPPVGVFRTIHSDREDPPFVPKKYNGRVDSADGNPFLIVPSTDPVEEVMIEVNLSIAVTGVMLK